MEELNDKNIKPQELVFSALRARKNAYAPYSGFFVGAALLGRDGKVYTGCNIENSSFSPTLCAERTAFSRAIADGTRSFSAIAIVGGRKAAKFLDFCPPCGVCRQFMREFCDENFAVFLYCGDAEGGDRNGNAEIKKYTLGELLPCSFTAARMDDI